MLTFENLEIHPILTEKLKQNGTTDLAWLITSSSAEMQRQLKITQAEALQIKEATAQILKPNNALTCGLLCQGINELTGESACGKTQICLQLALQNQLNLSIKGNKTLYVCTEDKFPSQRFYQMSQHLQKTTADMIGHKFGDHVYIEHVADADQLLGLLQNRVPNLLEKGEVGLIIIDSITALFRGQEETQRLTDRSKSIRAVGAELHKIAADYYICVLCVNQVTADMNISNSSGTTPALGLTWSTLVTTRIKVRRRYTDSPSRILTIVFSPNLPMHECEFTIDSTGIIDTPD